MKEEEKKAIELLENIKDDSWTTKYIMSSDSKNAEILLNLIEKLQKENEELLEVKVSASAYNRMLELEKEKSKYEWIRQNCLPQELVNKLYIPIQKVKDKIRHYQELQDNYIKKYDEINEGLQAMINVLQEIIEAREEKE